MSHYMTALAMRQVGLKPAAKIVLYWLADHHNSETGMCFPSLKILADECEMDVATVKRHLISLEGLGLIERTRRHRENGSQTSTQYILRMREPLAQNAPPPSAKCATPLAQNDTPHNLGNINHGNEPIGETKKRRKPEVELPDGWVPSERNIEDAIGKGMTQEEIEHEADTFRNHNHSKQSKYRDWDAAWRTWIANSIKWKRQRASNSPRMAGSTTAAEIADRGARWAASRASRG